MLSVSYRHHLPRLADLDYLDYPALVAPTNAQSRTLDDATRRKLDAAELCYDNAR